MNENAKLWVERLRSGDYKQGQGRLRSTRDEFCCLGVACDLYAETGNGRWERKFDSWWFSDANEERRFETGALIPAVREWLGLCDPLGRYGSADSLALRNDAGDTFDEIADRIESEPEGLFK